MRVRRANKRSFFSKVIDEKSLKPTLEDYNHPSGGQNVSSNGFPCHFPKSHFLHTAKYCLSCPNPSLQTHFVPFLLYSIFIQYLKKTDYYEFLSYLKLPSTLKQIVIFATCVFILVGPFCSVLFSYTCILVNIIGIQSQEGHRKAFSTCSSHLCVVGLSFGKTVVVYMFPKSQHMRCSRKCFPCITLFSIPMLSPLIYSLKNAEAKDALWRALCNEIIPSCYNAWTTNLNSFF